MVQDYLALAGIPVVGAADGREGLSALHQHRPCFILLDLSMPVMDGWEFRAVQRKLPDPELSRVPVMVLSSLPSASEEGDRLGAVDVLIKPVDLDRMVKLIRQHCTAV